MPFCGQTGDLFYQVYIYFPFRCSVGAKGSWMRCQIIGQMSFHFIYKCNGKMFVGIQCLLNLIQITIENNIAE